MIPVETYAEAIKRIMEKGFDGVEIHVLNREFQIRKEFYEDGFAERMKEVMSRCGVKAFSVGAHMDYTDSEKFDMVKKAIPIAKALGAGFLMISGPDRKKDQPFEPQWERMIKATRELCKVAEQNGMLLAMEHEGHFVVNNTDMVLKAFDEIGSPVMCVNADIGHIFLWDADPMETIGEIGEYIVHCHLENMKRGVHNHLVPDDPEGDMDLPEYIRKLRSVGFDGPAALDVYQYDYEAIAEESLRYLRGIL